MLAVLFDIDGTLISTGGAGGTALMSAFAREFGIERPEAVPFSGRTDRGIAANLFALHGVPDTRENFERLRLAYLQELPKQLPLHVGRVLPGVAELLESLGHDSTNVLGLLTGNMREGADLKLRHYGLDVHFRLGGYGDEHPDRDEVARVALDLVHRRTRGQHRRLVVVGDTPLDVRCARAIGAEAVAVSTGIHSRDELAAEHPDFLLRDMSNVIDVLAWLNRH